MPTIQTDFDPKAFPVLNTRDVAKHLRAQTRNGRLPLSAVPDSVRADVIVRRVVHCQTEPTIEDAYDGALTPTAIKTIFKNARAGDLPEGVPAAMGEALRQRVAGRRQRRAETAPRQRVTRHELKAAFRAYVTHPGAHREAIGLFRPAVQGKLRSTLRRIARTGHSGLHLPRPLQDAGLAKFTNGAAARTTPMPRAATDRGETAAPDTPTPVHQKTPQKKTPLRPKPVDRSAGLAAAREHPKTRLKVRLEQAAGDRRTLTVSAPAGDVVIDAPATDATDLVMQLLTQPSHARGETDRVSS